MLLAAQTQRELAALRPAGASASALALVRALHAQGAAFALVAQVGALACSSHTPSTHHFGQREDSTLSPLSAKGACAQYARRQRVPRALRVPREQGTPCHRRPLTAHCSELAQTVSALEAVA